MSGLSDLLKKDISFKRKPAAPKAEATEPKAKATTTTQEMPPNEGDTSPKRAKRAPKQKKLASPGSNVRHKQVVGLSVGASQLAAAVVVNNGRPKLV